MAANSILSLPIYSHVGKKIVYIISTFDILNFVVAKLGNTSLEDAQSKLDVSIEAAMTLDSESESYRILESDYQDKLHDVLHDFAQGAHRALITDATHRRKSYVFTQTDIIRYVYDHPAIVSPEISLDKTLQQLGLIRSERPVTLISDRESAYDGFKRMAVQKLLALPIVDSANHVVGTLSASDLRGLTDKTLSHLKSPVAEFLQAAARPIPKVENLVCSPEDTLLKVIQTLTQNRIHRVWVTDEHMKPIGVVSQTDVIAVLVGLPVGSPTRIRSE
ncbi:uncharacterized protein BJ171DRAFT_427463 [Polychytrium aggregatum]|uniref:uncharacterized protein n=1 Tax=Polychytrium aggregatum TaxID=110093 RepID=UPI0022FF19D2|nr:uncharacterized protein BJ171DRAFT_427463 [Polychytrium aggregatum]KAI9199628.1 hypothetical protein BJ171DRAFT_427463 [Polychytrium aggregatum]